MANTRLRTVVATAAFMLVVATLGYYWLFVDNGPATRGQFLLDLDAVRSAARQIPGDAPIRIEVESVSHTATPEIAIVAGTSWRKVDMVRNSYRVVFPRSSLLIDVGFDAVLARAAKVDRFDQQAWMRILAAMDRATAIVVTHEHSDHMGGLLTAPHWKDLLGKVILTPEQLSETAPIKPATWPDGFREGVRPTTYDHLLAVAPGVVLIKTPGHTPGSQMIYVRRADGQEYIFVGDTASLADNIRLNRIRSHYVTDFITHDDRSAVLLETEALHQLSIDEPAIALVPGHDSEVTTRFEQRALLTPGFSVP